MIIPNNVKLSDRVVRVLGLNPSVFTLQGTNTYLVGTGPFRILIDTGEGVPEYSKVLQESMLKAGVIGISMILCTHRHKDHIGGINQVQQLMKNIKRVPVYKQRSHKDDLTIKFIDISHGQVFKTVGANLRAYHTPGHTEDHVSFYLEEEGALFTGDCILGSGTSVFEHLGDLIKSLQILQSIPNLKRLYPGHGPVVEDGYKKIAQYLSHRAERENQIIELLSQKGQTLQGLIDILYDGYPPDIKDTVSGMMICHLEKLLNDKKVFIEDGTYFIKHE